MILVVNELQIIQRLSQLNMLFNKVFEQFTPISLPFQLGVIGRFYQPIF